ncbi:MAG: hypothetical protein U5L96_03105 [Owenweeksia sp.]|nr:hypothetical protein [Owenweeksia sp.]
MLDTLAAEKLRNQLSIRAICATGDTSEWATPIDFCTQCLAKMAPHTQNFDQSSIASAGNLGNCWYTANANLLGYGWRSRQLAPP